MKNGKILWGYRQPKTFPIPSSGQFEIQLNIVIPVILFQPIEHYPNGTPNVRFILGQIIRRLSEKITETYRRDGWTTPIIKFPESYFYIIDEKKFKEPLRDGKTRGIVGIFITARNI